MTDDPVLVRWHLEVDEGLAYYWAESDAWPDFSAAGASLSELVERVHAFAAYKGVPCERLEWEQGGQFVLVSEEP